MWWGGRTIGVTPTHTCHGGACHPQVQPIPRDYTFLALLGIVLWQFSSQMGPSEPLFGNWTLASMVSRTETAIYNFHTIQGACAPDPANISDLCLPGGRPGRHQPDPACPTVPFDPPAFQRPASQHDFLLCYFLCCRQAPIGLQYYNDLQHTTWVQTLSSRIIRTSIHFVSVVARIPSFEPLYLRRHDAGADLTRLRTI